MKILEEDKPIFEKVIMDFLIHVGKIDSEESQSNWKRKVENYLAKN